MAEVLLVVLVARHDAAAPRVARGAARRAFRFHLHVGLGKILCSIYNDTYAYLGTVAFLWCLLVVTKYRTFNPLDGENYFVNFVNLIFTLTFFRRLAGNLT